MRQHLRLLMAERDWGGLAIVFVAFAMALVALISLVSPKVEDFLLARHHAQAGFLGHVALLPFASMYSFDHMVLTTFDEARMPEPRREAVPSHWWQNAEEVGLHCDEREDRAIQYQHFPVWRLPIYRYTSARCQGRPVHVLIVSRGRFGSRVSRWVMVGDAPSEPREAHEEEP